MYDLVIKGGRVIDPAQSIDSVMDVAINGNKVAAVAKNIPAAGNKKVIDAKGKIVTPGLIDMHCHVGDGIIKNGAEIDVAGVKQGVTTVVDAGSVGEANFAAFPKFVIPQARTTVYCFLHICSSGLGLMPELKEDWEINVEAAESVIRAYPGLIKGVKIRLVGDLIARKGLPIFKIAKGLAKKVGLPIMVHIGDTENKVPASLTPEFLPLMEKGDILSHVFTAKQGSAMRPNGTFVPELKAAHQRGVIFEVAHGRFNMSYAVARKGLEQGIIPDVISSDVTVISIPGPTYGLTATMSKMMALGLSLNQVITMTTINPARVIDIAGSKGSLKPGADADVSVLEVVPGKWQLQDAEKETITAEQMIIPRLTVKAGKVAVIKLDALPENKAK